MKKLLFFVSAFTISTMCSAQEWAYKFYNQVSLQATGTAQMTRFLTLLPVPQTNEYQTVSDFTTSDGNVVEDAARGNQAVLVENDGFSGSFTVRTTFTVTPKKVKIDVNNITEMPYDTSSEIYKRFTGNRGDYVQTDNSYICNLGNQLWDESDGIIDYARHCYEYVAKNFRYINGSFRTLSQILQEGGGECGDFSTLVVNLLRYKGIPSRHILCLRLDGGYHVWCDFYVEGFGWIPLDATYKNSNPRGNYFGVYDGACVVVAKDFCYDYPGFSCDILQTYSYRYWYRGGSLNVKGNHQFGMTERVSGISSPSASSSRGDSAKEYDLSGRPVSPGAKGIVVTHGRKYVVK